MSNFQLFCSALLLGIISAVVFGLVFDQFTVRNSPEYFTIGHPIRPAWLPDPATHPTAVALYWGIAATWWVGVGLGFVHGLVLLIFNRYVTFKQLVRRHLILVVLMWVITALTFFIGPQFLDTQNLVPGFMLQQLSTDEIAPFGQNALTHLMAYLGAAISALFLFAYAIWVGWKDR